MRTDGDFLYQHRIGSTAEQMSDAQWKIYDDFLTVHGLPAKSFDINNWVWVKRRDGKLWFEAWRAVGGDLKTAPRCEFCPCCIQQERVVTPLITPVPFGGDFVDKSAVESGELQVTPDPDA